MPRLPLTLLLALACLAGAASAQQPGAGTTPAASASAAAVPADPASAAAAPATAQPASAGVRAGPPPGFAAPPLPKPDENNAQRARSQPGNNAPFWRQVRNSGEQAGYTSLPGPEMGVLVQSFTQYPGSRFTTAGEAWRQVRNLWILPYGGALLLITLVALAIFYFAKGPIGKEVPEGGRRIERFTPFERAAHWVNAIAFVVLAVSGIFMAFGKFFLLPVLGSTIFGLLTYGLKTVHNLVGPLFAVSLAIVFFTFVRDNRPTRADWVWVKRAGGMIGQHGEVPSHRFNAGEKFVFWIGVLLLGVIVVASGLVLDMVLPGIEYTRRNMQVANLVHAVSTVLMMAMFIGHTYMGTIGMKGAYKAMRHGYVDERWAHAHHALWADDIESGRIPAERSRRAREGTPVVPPATSERPA